MLHTIQSKQSLLCESDVKSQLSPLRQLRIRYGYDVLQKWRQLGLNHSLTSHQITYCDYLHHLGIHDSFLPLVTPYNI